MGIDLSDLSINLDSQDAGASHLPPSLSLSTSTRRVYTHPAHREAHSRREDNCPWGIQPLTERAFVPQLLHVCDEVLEVLYLDANVHRTKGGLDRMRFLCRPSTVSSLAGHDFIHIGGLVSFRHSPPWLLAKLLKHTDLSSEDVLTVGPNGLRLPLFIWTSSSAPSSAEAILGQALPTLLLPVHIKLIVAAMSESAKKTSTFCDALPHAGTHQGSSSNDPARRDPTTNTPSQILLEALQNFVIPLIDIHTAEGLNKKDIGQVHSMGPEAGKLLAASVVKAQALQKSPGLGPA
ncbi:hypothetical protein BJ912DRAFT_1065311 [Pholiota molesta]|nr:hypothetical protein BJ912DRAFT_1065311 [Pholiota molesta]